MVRAVHGQDGFPHRPLPFSESGQFAALISAVDPVATLAIFAALQVDPNLNSIVVGESVLNDAVALISFRAVTHYGIDALDEYESILISFVFTGSARRRWGSPSASPPPSPFA